MRALLATMMIRSTLSFVLPRPLLRPFAPLCPLSTHSTLPRVFVEDDLKPGDQVALKADQGHYLTTVLRLRSGSMLRVFNGRDGEYLAAVEGGPGRGKRQTSPTFLLVLDEPCIRPQLEGAPKDVNLLFSAIKPKQAKLVVEKATELGVTGLWQLVTDRTQGRRSHSAAGDDSSKLRAIAVEASEQSERLTVPRVHEPSNLETVR